MSTEHQQYSLENQMAAIQRYADHVGFVIVHTYSDAARSGVLLRRRTGLRQLLQDVVTGPVAYRHILVYDVSRWGRFQDCDEAAHYEFLCKSAGIPVHYCAEQFANDGSLPSSILKALKRTMAAEYSRELGTKVLEGQRRLARLGFKQGGVPGYGLRRMLVDSGGHPKQLLGSGERKSIATDRVILVPGPPEEVQVVRTVYRMFVFEGRTVYWIANELNKRGLPYTRGAKWDYLAVYNVLTHPKYMGCHVFGRSTQRLYTPSVPQPESNWTVTPGAFDAIMDQETFSLAQHLLRTRVVNRSNEQLLEDLKHLLAKEGRLTLAIIQNIATDRVILVPGPPEEVQVVRTVYRMFVFEGRTVYWIANELNKRGLPYTRGAKWDYLAVYNVLTHPKYMGCHVFGRSTQRLYTPSVPQPESNWTVTPGAFDAIMDQETFSLAQHLLRTRVVNRSNEQLLEDLKHLLAKEGRLTLAIIQNCAYTASPSAYRDRFGSLREAYRRIGYGSSEDFAFADVRRRTQALRDELISEIHALFPDDVSVVRQGSRFRPTLVVRPRFKVAILIARSVRTWKTALRWCIDPVSRERRLTTLLGRLNESNDGFLDMHILEGIDRRKRFHIRRKDPIFDSAKRLVSVSEFLEVIEDLKKVRRKSHNG